MDELIKNYVNKNPQIDNANDNFKKIINYLKSKKNYLQNLINYNKSKLKTYEENSIDAIDKNEFEIVKLISSYIKLLWKIFYHYFNEEMINQVNLYFYQN